MTNIKDKIRPSNSLQQCNFHLKDHHQGSLNTSRKTACLLPVGSSVLVVNDDVCSAGGDFNTQCHSQPLTALAATAVGLKAALSCQTVSTHLWRRLTQKAKGPVAPLPPVSATLHQVKLCVNTTDDWMSVNILGHNKWSPLIYVRMWMSQRFVVIYTRITAQTFISSCVPRCCFVFCYPSLTTLFFKGRQ